MTSIVVLALVLAGGVVAHELTHWVVARAAGRSPTIDWVGMEVRWRGGTLAWTDCMAALAPQTLGVVSMLAVLLAGIDVPVAGWLAWAMYVANGSRGDFGAVKRYWELRKNPLRV